VSTTDFLFIYYTYDNTYVLNKPKEGEQMRMIMGVMGVACIIAFGYVVFDTARKVIEMWGDNHGTP
jgi:hypothetical protein